MAFRIALVTRFSWSQPHDVNEHVAGLAAELRARGHRATVLGPSNRARDLAAGRRALATGLDADFVALGPAVPISRRSRMGVPVGVRANLAVALAGGRFDVVHGFEPGLPSLSYLALRDAAALTVATFFSPERLSYPPARARRDRPLGGRAPLPRALRGRVHTRTALDGASRAELLGRAAVFVPAPAGVPRVAVEAQAAAAAVASPPGRDLQPELAAAEAARLMEDAAFRARRAEEGRAAAAQQSFAALAEHVEEVYGAVTRRRRPPSARAEPLADRDWIVADLHMHTNWSHDCSTEVDELLDHAEAQGLGAIAVTDHNVFGGARDAHEKARDRSLIVIPGEEVKTAGEGEVIGLFLEEEIPRDLSFAETVAAIHEQGGLVYVPHPFDRLHSIPGAATLHRHLAEIDVFEVYNARLLFEAYNEEALRFARKYGLIAGAGSDAHVLQGVGTGALRMRRFEGAEEFLVSLRSAEVLRRPKSLAYLQGLKWVAQAKERGR